ncbi:SAM-dependent methyltransferase [Diplogelasinospora grovesii]|uniref:phosphoethanolamine N-methyltransferase n=1 Tax=Diplogelasinospora grovesii TaxID=303347 RepID=A0AAN6RZ06_9PEZI|nr:SAM-dependent methyltransferase [Diplogelasinospora grovesii]
MALYNLERAYKALETLSAEKKGSAWEASDTAALDSAAAELGLMQGDVVVDVGSGYGASGRYLYRNYGVEVVGVELQREIHEVAEVINKNSQLGSPVAVRSVNGDILRLGLDDLLPLASETRHRSCSREQTRNADHILSLLCIMHIPDRTSLFAKAAQVLKHNGKMYIEDFFAKQETIKTADPDLTPPVTTPPHQLLRDVISCPYLPSRDQYLADLSAAGLQVISFVDMSTDWTTFVHTRALNYRSTKGNDYEPSLAAFYDTVDYLFSSGYVGGCRITCVNTGEQPLHSL